MSNILEKAMALLNKDQIRALVLVSLGLQIVMIFFCPLRKRSGSKPLLFLLWVAYIGADYVATLALGSILTNVAFNTNVESPSYNLTVFWAPFLLLHLGGPDNMTSYAIEDNQLWLRHLVSFIGQTSVALIVLVQSNLQSTKLLAPSILVFIAGTMKYGERTLALRAASKASLGDPIPDHLMDLEKVKKDLQPLFELLSELLMGGIPHRSSDLTAPNRLESSTDITEGQFIFWGNRCVKILRANMAGNISFEVDQQSLRILRDRTFELIGLELSFFYDMLHTKLIVVYYLWMGWMVRFASFVSNSIALYYFHNSEKRGHDSSDVIITYVLLSTALFLEIYSLLLLVASKWTIVSLMDLERGGTTKAAELMAKFVSRAESHVLGRGNKRWWSCHMGQYSLLESCLKSLERKRSSKQIISHAFNYARDFLFGEKQSVEVPHLLEKIMIEHVQKLLSEALSDEGDYMYFSRKLRSHSWWSGHTIGKYASYFSDETKDLMKIESFEVCVIVWHIYTEIYYHASNDTDNRDMREAMWISNYMMHLLMKQSSMMPRGRLQVRLPMIHGQLASSIMPFHADGRSDIKQISQSIFASTDTLDAGEWKLSLLFEMLLTDLKKISESSVQWEIINDVWMEMLTYAALRCSPTEHSKTLSRGGELLTHYWLLWGHLLHFEALMESTTTP